MEFISKSEKETFDFALNFSKSLKGGEILLLNGDLGAGKTAFSKGVAFGLGVEDVVTSPTFTILNEHYGKVLNFYHFDFYRLEDESELKELGFDEFIGNKNGISAIEWFEKAPSILKGNTILIDIQKIDDNTRKIVVQDKEIKWIY